MSSALSVVVASDKNQCHLNQNGRRRLRQRARWDTQRISAPLQLLDRTAFSVVSSNITPKFNGLTIMGGGGGELRLRKKRQGTLEYEKVTTCKAYRYIIFIRLMFFIYVFRDV